MEKNQTTKINPSNKNDLLGKRIKSWVRRDSRMTAAQLRAYRDWFSSFGLTLPKTGKSDEWLEWHRVFKRQANVYLEVGFGSGQSLLASAIEHPEEDFIGIETHKPGVGALLQHIAREELTNIRVFHADVFDVLNYCIASETLAGIQVFFPDPWPKRRHYARRLIRDEFVALAVQKLKKNGFLHIATDWEDYAKAIIKVMQSQPQLANESDGTRSTMRPTITKFEARALQEGRKIWDFKFRKVDPSPAATPRPLPQGER